MSIDRQRVRQYLKRFDFDALFREELGWDTVDRVTIPVAADNRTCTLTAIAQKHGFIAYHCQPDDGQGIPERQVCNKIDRQVTDYTREHIIIYTDAAQQEQYWQWMRREQGKPVAPRGERYRVSQDGERLIQKLDALFIAWEEEDSLTLSDVKKRAKQAFDVEKVTKKFYAEFKSQHGKFLDFIKGIQDQFDKEWYASLMLNRLMFIYFIQQKGFLDGNTAYLQDRLQWCKANRGEDEFQSFYRFFLLKLFHDGLGSPQRDAELNTLLGKVPYLNGGLFEVHQLEDTYSDIQIPDSAFERIFAFFDQWDWHLDDRPDKSDREINPDVLGYIFEKYINQKQMGAYYTKEDITEYISKNTIIPYLFDAAEKGCKIAFEPGGSVWRLLQENPDRYLYDAVKHGVVEPSVIGAGNERGQIVPLPEEIAAGIGDVVQRDGWNRLAPAEYGLPTEIWREHVARRQRCLEVREKLRKGEIHSINDLITYNLDIRQFAQDVIDTCEGPELLRAFYKAITTVSVLDPTCGSGAFLFAALNILQPLYEACLERMQGFVDDLDSGEERPHPEKFKDFRTTLAQVAKHSNRNYFIYKSIILNNLYGVDIMEEATEICKLRLFLKLVSQVEVNSSAQNMGLEPLPDIDFNIRAGNTLVGFATLEEVRRAITQDQVKSKRSAVVSEEAAQFKLEFGDDLSRINEAAEIADRAYQMFRQMQTQEGMDGKAFSDTKQEVRRRLKALNEELNINLAKEYSVDPNNSEAYQKWLKTHQPFHWITEFYSAIISGGFDVIIGNPPYVEYRLIKPIYSVQSYSSIDCANLYAFTVERSLTILKSGSFAGLIIPLAGISVSKAKSLRQSISCSCKTLWHSSFGFRPSKLFEGVNLRLSILIAHKSKSKQTTNTLVKSSKYLLWNCEEREDLFYYLSYNESSFALKRSFPKIDSEISDRIFLKLMSVNTRLGGLIKKKGRGKLHYHRSPLYWIRAMDFEPHFKSDTKERSVHHFRDLFCNTQEESKLVGAILNSSLFYLWFTVTGNCRNLTGEDVEEIPFNIPESKLTREIGHLFDDLMQDYRGKSTLTVRYNCEYQTFYPGRSKDIIDAIDTKLAQHYGFTDEELDFIINYDIKYRMGLDSIDD